MSVQLDIRLMKSVAYGNGSGRTGRRGRADAVNVDEVHRKPKPLPPLEREQWRADPLLAKVEMMFSTSSSLEKTKHGETKTMLERNGRGSYAHSSPTERTYSNAPSAGL